MRLLRSFEFILVVFLLIVAGVYWIHYAPQLPDRVPTHFRAGGEADAWSSPERFGVMFWAVLGGQVLLFCGIALMLLKIRSHLISLPHREYWLNPERARRTREDLARRLMGFCAVTMIFYLLVFHFSVRAALDGTAHLGKGFNWVLGGFLGYTALWTGILLWRYSRVPRQGRDGA
jgi:uncharacterized membrane protein